MRLKTSLTPDKLGCLAAIGRDTKAVCYWNLRCFVVPLVLFCGAFDVCVE
jgi:hypothetical protein